MDGCDSISTSMATTRLDVDLHGTPTDQTKYHSMIGGLMYLTASSPTLHLPLLYVHDSRFKLIAYSDVNHAGCHDDCKSTSGGIQFFGKKFMSWSSKKQDCTTMSTAEAEYISLSAYYAQIIWMKTQLLDYGYRFNKILMYCDSKSAIAISCNSVQHSCTKHINIRYHFIKEHVERGTFELYFVGTEYQLADLFTKALPKERFEYLVHRIANKRFELEEANKKIDLVQPSCPPSSKILENILMRHPLRFALTASASVPWIYIQQVWHTLRLDDSKERFIFFIDTKEFTFSIFFNELSYAIRIRLAGHFATKDLSQPWQTLKKIFSRCSTTRVTGIDQPLFQIMQMLYCFVNNVHVDYAALI
ncbi:hypothetical protein Tco_1310255 [Tanacetum coccineum]